MGKCTFLLLTVKPFHFSYNLDIVQNKTQTEQQVDFFLLSSDGD